MNIIADTHTHTLASDHAYSTVAENAAAAAEMGLRFLCMTEHTPKLTGAPSPLHFNNLRTVPHAMNGVTILKGAEVNILDTKGRFDLTDEALGRLDWVIASLHTPCFTPATAKDHTKAWLAVAGNPLVDVIGHCGDGRYPFDEAVILTEFAKNKKIVEINAHSFKAREGSKENCPRIARRCAELGIRVVVSTDAHHASQVGVFTTAVEMLESIGFPEELVLNADFSRFLAVAREKAAKPMRKYLDAKFPEN